MRPFFGHFGSKWRVARHYGPPRQDEVVEPFAGSAGYSVFYEPRRVRLYDRSEDAFAAWHWLINCSEEDVRKVPDRFLTTEDWRALPDGPRQVVAWSTGFGQAKVGAKLKAWYLEWARGEREVNSTFWGPAWKDRLIRQKPKIREWSINLLDYREIPLEVAHYHVDPPYQGKPGRRYPHSEIDYSELADWIRQLPGSVDACENVGADWLPFTPLCSAANAAPGSPSRSAEAVWRNEPVELLDLISRPPILEDGRVAHG